MVTSIDATVFAGKDITSFDELQYFINLETILESAFADCKSLTRIAIPCNNLRSIGRRVFMGTNSLAIINVDSLNNWATSVSKDESWIDHQYSLYENGSIVERPLFASGAVLLKAFSFKYCNSIRSVTIEDSEMSFGRGVFWGCENLADVILPTTVRQLGDQLFYGCQNIAVRRNFTIK